MKAIAIIPARGGSKRVPRKNIRSFDGIPMIAWSIQASISSGCFEKVIVSTDDNEIAEIARSYGAETPFRRPENLSDDFSTTSQVIKHAIEFEQSEGRDYDFVCCIYPTAPLIKETNLQKGFELIQSELYDYVFSATSFAFPIHRSFTYKPNDGLQMLFPENSKTRSQDLNEIYHDAGQFYYGSTQAWLNDLKIFSNNSFPFILPRIEVIDIDTEEDFKEAEIKFKLLNLLSLSN